MALIPDDWFKLHPEFVRGLSEAAYRYQYYGAFDEGSAEEQELCSICPMCGGSISHYSNVLHTCGIVIDAVAVDVPDPEGFKFRGDWPGLTLPEHPTST